MMELGYVHVMVAVFVAFSVVFAYMIRKMFNRYWFLAFVFMILGIDVAVITWMYGPYFIVAPAGVVEVPYNYTTVVNSTTVTLSGTLIKTIYTQSPSTAYYQWIGIAVALISVVISFIFFLIASLTPLNRFMRRRVRW